MATPSLSRSIGKYIKTRAHSLVIKAFSCSRSPQELCFRVKTRLIFLQMLTHMVLVGNVTISMSEVGIGVLGKAQFLQTLTHQVMVGNVIMVISNMAIVV